MGQEKTNTTAVTHKLHNNQQFAIKSTFIGSCLGGGTAIAVGGPLGQQLLQAAVLSVAISLSLYWLLLVLAAWVTDETGDSILPDQTESTHPTTEGSATR